MVFSREPDTPTLQKPPWKWVWLTLATGVLALLAVYLNWESIPDPFPTHWNARGEADAFNDKTWANLFGMFGLITGILTLVIAACFGLIYQHAKHANGEDWQVARSRATCNSMLTPLGKWMFVLNAVVVVDIYLSITQIYSSVGLLIAAIIIVVALLLWDMARVQKWLDKHYPDPKTSEHMKWGMFYYNPKDPNMMVHRDLNSTFNMAHPGSWVVMGALLGIPIIVVAVAIILVN